MIGHEIPNVETLGYFRLSLRDMERRHEAGGSPEAVRGPRRGQPRRSSGWREAAKMPAVRARRERECSIGNGGSDGLNLWEKGTAPKGFGVQGGDRRQESGDREQGEARAGERGSGGGLGDFGQVGKQFGPARTG